LNAWDCRWKSSPFTVISIFAPVKVSIHTFILEVAKKRGLRAISLWGHAPQYLQARNVKVAYAVLKRLSDLIEIEMDLSELQRASDYFDHQVNELVGQDPRLQEIISKLDLGDSYLCSDCKAHFKEVKRGLDSLNVNYQMNPYLVRAWIIIPARCLRLAIRSWGRRMLSAPEEGMITWSKMLEANH
jgi:hypothetical protein